MHILIQEVFVFTGTVGRGSRCVGHRALGGGGRLVWLPLRKASGGVPCDHGGVVVVGEDAVEAAWGGGREHGPGRLGLCRILVLKAVQVTGDDGDWRQEQGRKR